MATQSTSGYVSVNKTDGDLVRVFRRFYCVSDVSAYIDEVIQDVVLNPSKYTVDITGPSFSYRTRFRVVNGAVQAWSDAQGYAPVLLLRSLQLRGIFKNSYYSFEVQVPYILHLNAQQISEINGWIDKSVGEVSPFAYKITEEQCRSFVMREQLDIAWYLPLSLRVANFLGRMPVRDELLGHVSLPTSSIKGTVTVLEAAEKFTENERFYAEENTLAMVAKRDPVDGLLWIKYEKLLPDVVRLMLPVKVIQAYGHVPLLTFQIAKSLKATSRNIRCYEDRLTWLGEAAQHVEPALKRWLFDVKQLTPHLLVETIKRQPDEAIAGSWGFLRANLPDGRIENFLLNPHSPLNEELFRDVTYNLIARVCLDNPSLTNSFVEVFLMIIQILARTRTNTVRYVERAGYHKFLVDGRIVLLNTTGITKVFEQYLHLVPNIERSYGGCVADICYDVMKVTGGNSPIWPDIPEIPPHMNFDFVTYVTPLKLTQEEQIMLCKIINRFRTKTVRLGGSSVGNRAPHPMDAWVEKVVPAQSRGTFYELLGTTTQTPRKL
ncbi:ORF4 [Air potato virus 1]|uniref:ORF4 n=1 Tax=Air potato virus 1 TaxID=2491018 RepID=A0A3G6V9C1_9CLOS|nr:ORF4 [Air potato virus 1]AZB50210.1 ORF4 [Air potato virus 1]